MRKGIDYKIFQGSIRFAQYHKTNWTSNSIELAGLSHSLIFLIWAAFNEWKSKLIDASFVLAVDWVFDSTLKTYPFEIICWSHWYVSFSKDETDQDAMEIREKCEDYVLNISDLQNQILVVKTPIRRVNLFLFAFYSYYTSNHICFVLF